ncbi:MAG TPA: BREX-3 system P-loop-containing protein BrxF [Anaerolineae bacterium]|nr:BREX-3 system P-loop-containing protein BrxF [Anaerolineae bacterium]
MSLADTADQLTSIEQTLPRLHQAYYRLALIVGKPGTGKTELLRTLNEKTGHPLINVNLEVSQRLLDYTIAERPRLVPRLLGDVINEANSRVVLLDNLELLFDVSLKLNPLQVLQSLSRNVTIVASWSGTYANNALVYAEPWHAEYRQYSLGAQDCLVFPMG